MKLTYSLVFAILAVCSGLAHAQPYPNKPIRIVIPYPPGGGTDIVIRAVGPRLSERLGQPVVVDNSGGATGTIGSEAVARAAPDGYTLLAHTNAGITILPHLNPRLPYDPIRDLAPVMLAASSPYVLVVHPKLPATSVARPARSVSACCPTCRPLRIRSPASKSIRGMACSRLPARRRLSSEN